MTAALPTASRPHLATGHDLSPPRTVRAWLWVMVGLVLVMVAIGGATRLTGSGLSITEWKPVTGAIPPLTESAWAAEFEKYRASSQYHNLNRGMELAEFKTIYWWEWSHRQLGRLIGVVFFLPLLWFWATGRIGGRLAVALLGIGALGGLQAAVGWIMVASGLEPGMTAVAPLKLAIHLTIASIILSLLVWVAGGFDGHQRWASSEAPPRWAPVDNDRGGLQPPDAETGAAGEPRHTRKDPTLTRGLRNENRRGSARSSEHEGRGTATAFLALLLVQIALGGLVAGSRAGLTYNTWPLMDGRFIPGPETLFAVKPWIENFVDNPALVQLNHRLAGYLVVALAGWQAWRWLARAPGTRGARRAAAIATAALAQAGLGIVTLLYVVPIALGLSHQLLAMALLILATHHAQRCWVGSRTPMGWQDIGAAAADRTMAPARAA